MLHLLFSEKFRRNLFLLVGVVVLAVPFGAYANTSSLSDLVAKQNLLRQQILAQQKAAQKAKQQAQQLSQKVQSLQQSINTTSQQINDTQSQIEEVAQSITDKESEITQTEAQLEAEKQNQDEAIRTLYQIGDPDPLRSVLASNSISDIIQQNQYLASVETRVQMIIDQVNKTKAALEQEKQDLQSQKDKLNQLKAQQESQKVNLAVQQQQTVVQKADATAQQQLAEDQMKQLQAQIADVQKKISLLSATKSWGTDIVSGGTSNWWYGQQNYSTPLGNPYDSRINVANYGCLITSLAMVATYYGHDISPADIASHSEFFDRQGNAYTSTIANNIGLSIQSSGSKNWSVVDDELANGHPVIVSVYMRGVGVINSDGSSHFIVLQAKSGSTYIMQDPLGQGRGYSVADVRSMIVLRPQ